MKTIEDIMQHPRYTKYREWSRGHTLHADALSDVDREFPSQITRAFGGWSEVWPRPSVSNWEGYDNQLVAAQEEWDADNEHTQLLAQDKAKRDQEKSDLVAAEQTREDARIAAEAAELKLSLKRQYLSMPGTSEADFENAYPQLIEDHRRKNMPDVAVPTTLNADTAF